MKTSKKTFLLAGFTAVAVSAVLLAPSTASATTIYLNVPDASLNIPLLTPVVTARDRLSRTGSFDQVLYKQPNLVGAPNADLVGFINSTYIGSDTYDFTLKHNAALDKYDFSLTNGTVTGDVKLNNAAAANSTISKTFAANELDYNILHVLGIATTTGSSVSFNSLSFTPGAGLTTSGILETLGNAPGTYDQWLAAPTGTNLDNFDWTIFAKVTLTAGGTNPSSGEGIKFEISGKSGNFTPPPPPTMPEPSILGLFGLGLAALGLARRRHSLRVATENT